MRSITYVRVAIAVLCSSPGLSGQAITVRYSAATEAAFDAEARAIIESIADAAYADVRRVLPALTGPITLSVSAGTDVIPETGDGAAALEPGHALWVVDPSRPGGIVGTARARLRVSLFHELHHLVRGYVMTGSAAPISLLDAVVSEGLATVFSRDFAADDPPWGHYPADVREWVDELLTLPSDAPYRTWLHQHPDGRRWIGYKAGTYIVDQAVAASGRSSAELVSTPTEEILRLAGVR